MQYHVDPWYIGNGWLTQQCDHGKQHLPSESTTYQEITCHATRMLSSHLVPAGRASSSIQANLQARLLNWGKVNLKEQEDHPVFDGNCVLARGIETPTGRVASSRITQNMAYVLLLL